MKLAINPLPFVTTQVAFVPTFYVSTTASGVIELLSAAAERGYTTCNTAWISNWIERLRDEYPPTHPCTFLCNVEEKQVGMNLCDTFDPSYGDMCPDWIFKDCRPIELEHAHAIIHQL